MAESFDHRPPGWIGQSRKCGTQSIHNHMVVHFLPMSSVNFAHPLPRRPRQRRRLICSAGLQTGVPNDRSSPLGWETGCRAGLQTRISPLPCSLAPLLPCSLFP